VFPLPMGITRFGRDADCDVVLDDPTVSGRHAEFDRGDSGVALRDAGSFNGTYLNRNLCHHATLTDGDEVWIGRFHFGFSDAYADHSRPGRPPASSGNDVA
jgi:pSer/pThr/pTyr-binding forkhead associated (FHA) protein